MLKIVRYDRSVEPYGVKTLEIKPKRNEIWTVRDITMDYVPDAFVMSVMHKDLTIEEVKLNETVEECLDKALEKEDIVITKDSPLVIVLNNITTATQDFTITLSVHVGYVETGAPITTYPSVGAPAQVQVDITPILEKLDLVLSELKEIKERIPVVIDNMICFSKLERGGE